MVDWIKVFDLNQKGLWFSVSISIILFLLMLFLPKKNINWVGIYFTFPIISLITWLIDTSLFIPFDLLDLGNPHVEGVGDVLLFTFVPASLSCLFLNYFVEKRRWLLTIIFTIISLSIELGLMWTDYLVLHGWHTIYSLIVYLSVFGFLLPLHRKILTNYTRPNY
ncbi:hypothetical protein [Sporolactobacillus terrae]|uniref:Uncharacterized protein n=1 Tax=Sporolactobacillus terrae TaxID=269673 RepID=A0A5K7X4Q4_9BACL|nr:hypothetical protein [Sporolactobacillus terrae]BBN99623.1 hypothetical protein St703_23280 [Sporolactobacillus terrae]